MPPKERGSVVSRLLGSHPQASSDACPHWASGYSQAEGMVPAVPPLVPAAWSSPVPSPAARWPSTRATKVSLKSPHLPKLNRSGAARHPASRAGCPHPGGGSQKRRGIRPPQTHSLRCFILRHLCNLHVRCLSRLKSTSKSVASLKFRTFLVMEQKAEPMGQEGPAPAASLSVGVWLVARRV